MKQTAVEWQHVELMRINFEYATMKITPREFQEQTKDILDKAKEMEKQQIIDANWEASEDTDRAEQYYNETFKSK
jgi:hypothetical protein